MGIKAVKIIAISFLLAFTMFVPAFHGQALANSESNEDLESNEESEIDEELESNEDSVSDKDSKSNEDSGNDEELESNEDSGIDEELESNEDSGIDEELESNEESDIDENLDSNEEIESDEEVELEKKPTIQYGVAKASTIDQRGIAKKRETYIRTGPKTTVDQLKIVSAGTILNIGPYNEYWFQVSIDGKIGYIHKKHFEQIESNQVSITGVAKKHPTNVRTSASTKSKVLSTFPIGSVIEYNTFSSHWYEITVNVGGKKSVGYIHKKHVENTNTNQESLTGFTLKSPTSIRLHASTQSDIVTRVDKNSIVELKTLSSHWYEAKVKISGKVKTGYIHKYHVDLLTNDVKRGVALKQKTIIRTEASTKSSALRSVLEGTLINFEQYNKYWYRVILNNDTIGYIHKKHIVVATETPKNIVEFTLKSPTNVRSTASTESKVINTFPIGAKIEYKTFSKFWHEVTVTINGSSKKGYIHRKHLGENPIDQSNAKYNYTFKKLVDNQFARGTPPNKDGGGSVTSKRGEVEFFMNPANFPEGTSSHFQFLVLNEKAGLNAKELNNTILKGKGILEGHGKAFVDAGKKNNMNEAYLISHALLETGNGSSTLAKGIWVDQFGTATRKSGKLAKTSASKFMVYNVYGYGAANACPIDCGAQTAYDQGWFTPQQAIIGGSNKIETGYIGNGLNTLYKMRFNPANPVHWRQYATHTKWAYGQTSRIASIYNELNDYTLTFDVPSFKNMPNYDNGADAKITGGTVNFRTAAGTSNSIITKLAINTKVTIIGSTVVGSEGWYKLKANGKTGWAAADYVELTN